MRHKKSFNHLGRTASHRKAMLSNMATSLIMHKRITTTLAKAKALRGYVEPLITKSKNDTTHSRRIVFSYLQDKDAITELFRDISRKVADRPGGYTRIIKLGTRQGDNAEMAMIELVDYNEHLLAEKTSKKSKSSRRRRGAKKKTIAETTQVTPELKTKPEDNTQETQPVTEEKVLENVNIEEVKKEEPEAEKVEPNNKNKKEQQETNVEDTKDKNEDDKVKE